VARHKQPINAGVSAGKPPQGEKKDAEDPKPPRRHVSPALKLIGGAVVLAIVFIVAAVLGGRGSQSSETSPGAAAPVSGGGSPKTETPAGQTSEELGYPAFATKNTTRVGGADPAANAAGVALATFPSTTANQRPLAVTFVGEDDWQGAIAASVLMAPPVKAPVLISAADDLPDPTSKAFAALDPLGSGHTLGAQAFVVGDVATPGGLLHVKRIEAGEPAVTAAAIQQVRDQLLGPPKHVVVTSAEDPEFAMPAAAWAARSGDAVLFADADKLPVATAKALMLHPKVPIYVLGPSSAISSDVFHEIVKIDDNVRRVSGEDPVDNAIALARYSNGDFGWNINDPGHGFVVARSDSPLDAAAAAPLSASGTWGPLLLTDSADTLPSALRGYLLDVKPGYTTNPTRAFYNHAWVIGDQEAIDVSQQAEIDNLAELAKIGGEG
jgi:putative cell wall binding repeat protein